MRFPNQFRIPNAYSDIPISVNLVKNVSAFDTPFAPLGHAIGWITADYTPFASLRLWTITYQHPPNHDEYQTRIRPSAFGVDLAECQTRIHSVDFGVEGV